MRSKATYHVVARFVTTDTSAAWSRHILEEVGYDEYLEWFQRVGKSHLFEEEMWESKRSMWFVANWARGFEDRFMAFYKEMRLQEWQAVLQVSIYFISNHVIDTVLW